MGQGSQNRWSPEGHGEQAMAPARAEMAEVSLMSTPDIGLANWFLQRALRTPERSALAFESQTRRCSGASSNLPAVCTGSACDEAIGWLSSD
jgi:hypothetical protein